MKEQYANSDVMDWMEIRKGLFPHFSRDFIIKLTLIGTAKKKN